MSSCYLVKHMHFVCTTANPHKQVRQLQHLSDTHWACWYAAVDVVCSTIDSILATLQYKDGGDRHKAVEASGIYLQINLFKFLATLTVYHHNF